MRNGGHSKGWLTLTQASRALGVAPNTLRRWADRGEIPSFTTPGGHRRFPVGAVEALVPATRARRPALRGVDQMVQAYRRARSSRAGSSQPKPGWLVSLSDEQRTMFRQRGTRLVATLLAHLDAGHHDAAASLRGAGLQARDYGRTAAQLGASLADAVEGFLRFRKPFIDELGALARRRHLDTREATALLADADSALDQLLIAIMAGHASAKEQP